MANLEVIDRSETRVHICDFSEVVDRTAVAAAELAAAAFRGWRRETDAAAAEIKPAFEARRWPDVVALSRRRLGLQVAAVARLARKLAISWPDRTRDAAFRDAVETRCLAALGTSDDLDLAIAFLRQVRVALSAERRMAGRSEEAPVERPVRPADVLKSFDGTMPVTGAVAAQLLDIAGLTAPWREKREDARLSATEINRALLRLGVDDGEPITIEMVDACFFRNRGAYLLGRFTAGARAPVPLVVAILNGANGLHVDAVLIGADQFAYVLGSARAPLHAASPRRREIAAFVDALTGRRPPGLRNATIGLIHPCASMAMDDLNAEFARSGERLAIASDPGPGVIGFSAASSDYVLKAFCGRPAVRDPALESYRRASEADRAGSLPDGALYETVALDAALFEPELLAALSSQGAAVLDGRDLLFPHLVVERQTTPLSAFLATARPEERRQAVLNLGDCIRNSAACDLFDWKLDVRGYGVSPSLRVHLVDCGGVERLTEVTIATEGSEEGAAFRPAELTARLRLDDPELVRIFRSAHAELMSAEYWRRMQRAIHDGTTPEVRSYPPERKLQRHVMRMFGCGMGLEAAE